MNLENFTEKAQAVLRWAQTLAVWNKNPDISVFHALKEILKDDETIVKMVLDDLKVNIADFWSKIDEKIKWMPTLDNAQQTWISPELHSALAWADKIKDSLWDSYVSLEHIFLSIANESKDFKKILEDLSIKTDEIKDSIKKMRWWKTVDTKNPELKLKVLEKFAINLTKKARDWKIDPVLWRDEEIRRAIQILSRRRKNNPVIVWEAWVWKTAIVEWLAQKIVNGEVPKSLRWKQVFALDMWSLIAWAKYKWEFEERLKWVLDEVKESKWNIILFIDEIHTIVWAWWWWGWMDAWNLIKPALSRWEFACIWATTLAEYRQYIEKDSALERRFQAVLAEEPTEEDAIMILEWIKEKYEMHHWIQITDDAIRSAVHLSVRYLSDRKLPDKAIDLIDEAAASLKMQLESEPEELSKLKKDLLRLEVEKEWAKKNITWEVQEKKFEELEKNILEKKEKLNELSAKWEWEKTIIQEINNKKEEIDKAETEAKEFERQWKLDKVAEVRYWKIPTLKIDLEEAQKRLDWLWENKFISDSVWEENIAQIIAQWTWIPVKKLVWSEKQKLKVIEQEMWKKLIWQEIAIKAVSDAIRRSRMWLSDDKRPVWSFLFLGTTWVWKTELAKALANFLFNDESLMIRFDMSEYMEKHSVAKLIWAPPGYVWYEEWWKLTEAVRRKPYSVLLFDEVEKAHPDVFNLMLQVLDDWRLTDSRWKTVSFKNTIVIMTSNLWSQKIFDMSENNQLVVKNDKWINEIAEKAKTTIFEDLRWFFKPEFLNRIDDIIIFHPLTKDNIRKILEIKIAILNKRIVESWINLILSNEAKEFLTEKWFDPAMWGRPLNRALQTELMDTLAMEMIDRDLIWNIYVLYDEEKDQLVFSNEKWDQAFDEAELAKEKDVYNPEKESKFINPETWEEELLLWTWSMPPPPPTGENSNSDEKNDEEKSLFNFG